MQFRHEVKFEVNPAELLLLRSRLDAVLQPDPHAVNGVYEIRSLYFDTADDKALRKKTDGVQEREKYRIRLYNNDPATLKLERKYKYNNLGYKEVVPLTPPQAQALAKGDFAWLQQEKNAVLQQLYFKMQAGLRAKVIVDYSRRPYLYPAGNVRVTLDTDLRTGLSCTDFLNPDCVTVPAKYSPNLMEVKWDNYLPDVVRHAVSLPNRHAAAFSKYASCRQYD